MITIAIIYFISALLWFMFLRRASHVKSPYDTIVGFIPVLNTITVIVMIMAIATGVIYENFDD